MSRITPWYFSLLLVCAGSGLSCQGMIAETGSQPGSLSPVELAKTIETDPLSNHDPGVITTAYGPETLPVFPEEQGPSLGAPAPILPKPRNLEPMAPQMQPIPLPRTSPLLSGIPVPGNHAMPADFRPWWEELIQLPIRGQNPSKEINPESLRLAALANSPYIHVIQQTPRIREWSIVDAESIFDWQTFVETNYDDTSDPVGNTLTTGGPPRLRDNKLNMLGGFRRKYFSGGELEFSQSLGLWDSNSRFFDPQQQGNARLEISYTQPLLLGKGEEYNRSLVVLAHVDSQIAQAETSAQLQDHMAKVEQGYWYLYRARAIYVQRLRSYLSSEKLVETIKARQDFDIQQRDLVRAEASMAQRYSNLLRAAIAVEEAEIQLRGLIDGSSESLQNLQMADLNLQPDIAALAALEMIPQQIPQLTPLHLSHRGELKTALYHRPDVQRALKAIEGAEVRYNVAVQEMQPRLDLILSTYLAGLQGEHDVSTAWSEQFTQGEPGYAIGFLFDMPLGRRGPTARMSQRELELQQALMSLQLSLQRGRTEVDLAMKKTQGAWQEILSRYHAMHAQSIEVRYLEQRYQLPGGVQVAILLSELLDAQDRLNLEEEAFVNAQVNYMLGLVELHRATGTLLRITPTGGGPYQHQPVSMPVPLPPAMQFQSSPVEQYQPSNR